MSKYPLVAAAAAALAIGFFHFGPAAHAASPSDSVSPARASDSAPPTWSTAAGVWPVWQSNRSRLDPPAVPDAPASVDGQGVAIGSGPATVDGIAVGSGPANVDGSGIVDDQAPFVPGAGGD